MSKPITAPTLAPTVPSLQTADKPHASSIPKPTQRYYRRAHGKKISPSIVLVADRTKAAVRAQEPTPFNQCWVTVTAGQRIQLAIRREYADIEGLNDRHLTQHELNNSRVSRRRRSSNPGSWEGGERPRGCKSFIENNRAAVHVRVSETIASIVKPQPQT
ncbi:hypothetical protein VNI00_017265 [Paramarasmius palmivorus]|uniref:Uncharacterized protein n=1 Tax=Paramarasmius palmivorus TaxID=297713 RepID=A0AAW0B8Z3_9AGAR